MITMQDVENLDFNLDEIRAKYAYERDRRLRRDGDAQYVETVGAFASYGDYDPYVKGDFSRDPRSEDVEVLLVGAGFGSLTAAAELQKRGVDDVLFVEAGGDFGGTWYWNRYPGAQCDIDSYIYLPLLEETGYVPKEKYSYQPEIFEQVQRIADHFGFRDQAVFRTRIIEMVWDENIQRWRVHTDRGDEFRARFIINSTGLANRPKLPGIPGLENFVGKMFHTSRWDYEYTGGDTGGGLDKLADKRVAVIGTGATAIQVVPHVGKAAKHLYVFQRTPSSVDLRGNTLTDPEWRTNLKPGWQNERRNNFDAVTAGEVGDIDLVQDCWTDMLKHRPKIRPGEALNEQARLESELFDVGRMHTLRQRIEEIVEDPETAEALKPWYPQFCKRPTFNDEYLPTFNRPNVTLIDTSWSRGVDRITPQGIVVNGTEYQVDCIIFATGFEITSGFERQVPIRIVGREGVTLADHWKSGISSLHGYTVRGFPNWFFTGIGQTAISPNYSSVLVTQAEHIAYVIAETRRRGFGTVQPTQEAEAQWVEIIRATTPLSVAAYSTCTPGIFNNEGQIAQRSGGGFQEIYTPGMNAFKQVLKDWRDEGAMIGLELEPEVPGRACPVRSSISGSS